MVWSYSGVRPLLDDDAGDPSAVTRDYQLEFDAKQAPLLSVWGGKITTFRKLAEEAAQMLCERLAVKALPWTAQAPLPGGDLAARRGWRAALGYLSLAPEHDVAFTAAFHGVDPLERAAAEQQIARSLNSPLASSLGRLFDAAAAVIGVRNVSRYEGHAAMELESVAGRRAAHPLPFPVTVEDDVVILEPVPLLVALGERRAAGVPVPELAACFHESIATAAAEVTVLLRESTGISVAALGGGVFQNARLLVTVERELRASGLVPLRPLQLGPNDGAVSYGQAAVAAARLAAGTA